MPGPSSRAELLTDLDLAFGRLEEELEGGGSRLGSRFGNLICIDSWTVKDVLSVRTWWTEAVVGWTVEGLGGEVAVMPHEDFSWKQTPALNESIVAKTHRQSYKRTRMLLQQAYASVALTVDLLSDEQLLLVGQFQWADNWPVSRWLAINTTRQYVTARSLICKAIKAARAQEDE